MKNQILNAFLLLTIAAVPAAAQTVNKRFVTDFDDSGWKTGGTSTIVRHDDSITAAFVTRKLTPGSVYTLWYWIYNAPENCNNYCTQFDLGNQAVRPSLVYAAGATADSKGEANFAATLEIGDMTGVEYGPGLENPNAEIFMVVRDHGPAIPGSIDEQLNTFEGGCDVNHCFAVQSAWHQSDSNDMANRLAAIEAAVDRIAQRIAP